MSNDNLALVPRAERLVDFYGDPIAVALVGDEDLYVPLRTLSEYLGLTWSPQLRRVQRDEVLSRKARMVTITGVDGRPRDMFCLPLDMLPGWLFGLTVSKVRPELAPKLQRYREECFKVLWREFQGERQVQERPPWTSLAQVREMALAIAKMAEQQMIMEGRIENIDTKVIYVLERHTALQDQIGNVASQVSTTNSRLDKAAEVVGELQRRMGDLEQWVEPAAYVTDAQAAEISNEVKALAQHLSKTDPSRNHYQSIFAELYRRFRVSSYKLIKQSQFSDVLVFLDEWQVTLSPKSSTSPKLESS